MEFTKACFLFFGFGLIFLCGFTDCQSKADCQSKPGCQNEDLIERAAKGIPTADPEFIGKTVLCLDDDKIVAIIKEIVSNRTLLVELYKVVPEETLTKDFESLNDDKLRSLLKELPDNDRPNQDATREEMIRAFSKASPEIQANIFEKLDESSQLRFVKNLTSDKEEFPHALAGKMVQKTLRKELRYYPCDALEKIAESAQKSAADGAQDEAI